MVGFGFCYDERGRGYDVIFVQYIDNIPIRIHSISMDLYFVFSSQWPLVPVPSRSS